MYDHGSSMWVTVVRIVVTYKIMSLCIVCVFNARTFADGKDRKTNTDVKPADRLRERRTRRELETDTMQMRIQW